LLAVPLLGIIPLLLTDAAEAGRKTIPFADARLKIEVNATDGDAGLQVLLDGEAWNEVSIVNPAGQEILNVEGTGPLMDHGLTELFSESSEPPFEVFPLEQFKQLFPEGDYAFRGITIDGNTLVGEAMLTHDIPDGPQIVAPIDGQTVRDELVVEWEPVTTPLGIDIASYQVVVTREDPLRVFSADLPATARTMPIPSVFLEPKTKYKVEVLAIEASGNQTLTEVAFTVK
ncbi:MAG: hypothetical protein ACRDVZ_17935, partial [Jiangellaceae bacterium]